MARARGRTKRTVPRTARTGSARGFTLVELLLALVLAGTVLGALYGLLTSQFRTYSTVRERTDVHSSLRSAGALLAWELRGASAPGGDLYDIQPQSLTLRSFQGTGVICRKHLVNAWYALSATEGEWSAEAVDSALVFQPGATGTTDDAWRAVDVQDVDDSPITALSTCAWPDGRAADLQLVLAPLSVAEMAAIAVGSPVRGYRQVTYGLYERDGRSWLGWELDGAWDVLAGPLQDEDGLLFTYYDASGNPTTDPGAVSAVEVVLRAESDRVARPGAGFESDSLHMRLALRN